MERLWFVIPELVLFAGVVVVAILGLVRSHRLRGCVPWVTGLFIIAAGVAIPLIFTSSALERVDFILPWLGGPSGIVACIVALALLVMTVGRVVRG